MAILCAFLSALLIVAVAWTVPLQAADATAGSIKNINYRLPTNVKPTYYTVKLLPNIEVGDFYGETNIKIVVSTNETKVITLHAKDLKIEQLFTSIIGADHVPVKPFNQTIDEETDFLTLHFSKPGLGAGQYTLNFKFTGKLNDQPHGFYRGSYINELGEKSWFAASHFTPTHARRAFPCFDEPSFKAKFEIITWSATKYSVISNMPSVATPTLEVNSEKWTQFRVTPVMSTYEVAFVISDFKNITSDDNKLRFWSRSNKIHMGNYAQRIAEEALILLEDYTNFEYIIPTINNVALPHFQSGAEENWGLVTYPERDILFLENVTTTNTKQDIALMMSRELAKQWFGNLVSPAWWEYAWLNEGLPNFFQYFIADQIETNWRLMDQFVIKNLQQTALIADSIENPHPLNAKVNSPVEISGVFDTISSSKTGGIIRMFSHALGAKVLRTGLKEYVKKYAYKAATSDDLFTILANAKGVPKHINVKGALESWVKQPGYPIVNVIRRYYYREYGIEKQYKDHWFQQHRFYATKPTSIFSGVWTIPVTYTTEDSLEFENTLPHQWVNSPKSPDYYPGVTADKWIIYNKQQTGFYRVNYDLTNWNLLAKYLKTPNYSKIHVLNRAQLLDDSFNLVQSEHLTDHKIFLDISRYLELEDDYVPWYPALRAFSDLNKALIHTDNYNLFKLYLLRLIGKLEKSVGYSEVVGDTHTTKLVRVNAIDWACKTGSKDCNSATLDKLIQHVEGTSKISTDLRKVVLCAGIRNANAPTWDKTFAYYQRTRCPKERSDIIYALGCSANSRILKSYLEKTQYSQNNISLKDVVDSVITGSEVGVDAAMDFIKKNYNSIIQNGETNQSVLNYVNAIGSRMTIEDQTDKLERFINSLIAENAELADALTENALANALRNIAWLERYESRIITFLQEQKLTENTE